MAAEREVLSRLVEDHRRAADCARRMAMAASVTATYGSELRALATINKRLEGGCRQMAVLMRGDARWLMQARAYSQIQTCAAELARVRLVAPVIVPGAVPLPKRWQRLADVYAALAAKVERLATLRTGRAGTLILPASA